MGFKKEKFIITQLDFITLTKNYILNINVLIFYFIGLFLKRFTLSFFFLCFSKFASK